MGIVDRIKRRLPILGAPAPRSEPPPARRPEARPSPGDYTRTEAAPPRPAADSRFPALTRGSRPVGEWIPEIVKAHDLVIFMKGSPNSPQCGFSASASGLLAGFGRPLHHVDVLADPDIREGVKAVTNWPTIPQIFIGGEFVGGADILREMKDSGELQAMIDKLPA